jgi:hypothetical protein
MTATMRCVHATSSQTCHNHRICLPMTSVHPFCSKHSSVCTKSHSTTGHSTYLPNPKLPYNIPIRSLQVDGVLHGMLMR